jgi:hypothetical protein
MPLFYKGIVSTLDAARPCQKKGPHGAGPSKKALECYRWAPAWLVVRVSEAGKANAMYSPE